MKRFLEVVLLFVLGGIIATVIITKAPAEEITLTTLTPSQVWVESTNGTDVYYYGGNVGIGTTSPGAKLEVVGSSDVAQLIVTASATQSNANPLIKLQKSDGTALLGLHSDDSRNVFLGLNAGRVNDITTGNGVNNTFIGSSAGYSNTSGYSNLAIGANALYSNTTGFGNLAVGPNALYYNTTSSDNTAIGISALYANTSSGNGNSAVGRWTLKNNTTGAYNTAVGAYALSTGTTFAYNSAVGYMALYRNTGGYNSAMGYWALKENTTGIYNVALGPFALGGNTTGSYNTVIGAEAGRGFGQSFSNNSLFGYKSGYALTTGSNNILLGYQAGDNLTTGGNNIVIGYDINAPLATSANTLNIGNLIFATGLDGTGDILSTGNVGIGTTTPERVLDIAPIGGIVRVGTWADISGDNGGNAVFGSNIYRLGDNNYYYTNTHGSLGYAGIFAGWGGISFMNAAGATTKDTSFTPAVSMRINSDGNVGIGTIAPGYKLDVAGDINTTGDVRKSGQVYSNPDYVFEPGYKLMPLADLKRFVVKNKNLPDMPSTARIKKEGVMIFQQNRLMLEKLEEAYLYIFNLSEKIDEQQAQIGNLKSEIDKLKSQKVSK